MSDQLTISIDPSAEGTTYTVRLGTAEGVYGAEHLTRRHDSGVKENAHIIIGEDVTRQTSLVMFNNLVPELGTNAPELQLHYLSYGVWRRGTDQPDQNSVTYFLFGTPTPNTDMPRTGTANYALTASGHRTGGAGAIGGRGSLTANFGSGQLATQLALFAPMLGAYEMPLANIEGTGAITGSGPFFEGALTSSNSQFKGDFKGSFFGPNAAEAGYTFMLNRPSRGEFDSWDHIIGVAVGAKQ